MFHEPKTKEEAQKHRYSRWAGNPKGLAFDPEQCAAEVFAGWNHRQCMKAPGNGPDALYCKVHAKMLKRPGLPNEENP